MSFPCNVNAKENYDLIKKEVLSKKAAFETNLTDAINFGGYHLLDNSPYKKSIDDIEKTLSDFINEMIVCEFELLENILME